MSKKIFFIVLTCCLLVATFCVSFAGAPQVQSAPADIRAVLDRPDCAAASLIVPPVVEPPLMDFVVPDSVVGTWYVDFDHLPSSSDFFTFNDYISDFRPYITVIYEDVTYNTATTVFLSDTPGFIYEPTRDSSEEIYVTSSFYFVIDSLNYRIYDTNDVLMSPDTVLADFPDGFLTRVPEGISGVEITGDIVDILVSGIVGFGESLGASFSTLTESIFINVDGTGLSTFGILVVVFAAVSLGLSLTRWVLNFCSSCGKRNR